MRGYTTYGPKSGQSNCLHKTRKAAENALRRYALKNPKSDRKVVVVADHDLLFHDEAFKKPVWRPGCYRKFAVQFIEGVKTGGKYQTVKQALDEKRRQLKGKVTDLYLNCGELFYRPSPGDGVKDSVYPVSMKDAQEEAEFFGCEVHEV